MPNESKHIEKYQHNFKLLSDSSIDSSYNDWKITIIFYAAVHIVESFLGSKGLHTTSHKDRHKSVMLFSELKRIANEYQTLYMLSIKSRYECIKFSDQDVDKAVKLLEKIKNVIVT